MKKLSLRFALIFGSVVLVGFSARASSAPELSDTTIVRKSTIKLDITSYWLYRNAIVFSYERVTKPNQSFSITAGVQQFPQFFSVDADSIEIKNNFKASGFKFGGEYRFYLAKENKYPAPRGVHIGPYFSFLSFKNDRTLQVNNNGDIEEGLFHTKLNVLNIGVQLGYQFVLNDRWTIDLTFIGPSISKYSATMKLDDNFTFDLEDIDNALIDGLIEKFPGFSELISDKELSSDGKIDTWAYGYRYQFQVGYHFGRKKK
jgi:hypothetical protein